MIKGAARKNATVATRSRQAARVNTAEIDSTASCSERVARRETNTGTNVAVRTPPSTRSCTMFGVLLARLNESERVEYPRA
jgi:hypothetical protein